MFNCLGLNKEKRKRLEGRSYKKTEKRGEGVVRYRKYLSRLLTVNKPYGA